ncbi:MAG: gamma-glutamyltransferase family protein [Betaproteobacteria bacterium]|nr:MAG: gamma-glutamyltransferase family protein [Betaproteobacteria bacterium]
MLQRTAKQIEFDTPYPTRRRPTLARNVVSTSQPLAAQAGLRMLLAGGNAVDAALAAAITLTVVEPTSNGIGSDAFAIVWDGRQLHGLNASGRAPAAWTPEYFKGHKAVPVRGWNSVSVPGCVSAWVDLSERFGKLPFEKLFAPAIEYAANGFPVSPFVAERWGPQVPELRGQPGFADAFLRDGRAPRAGEIFRFPDQARTLEKIAATKGEAFYRGELAEKIDAHARATGGAMTRADLAAHSNDWVGTIIQDSAHLQIEAVKLAFADAYRFVGDARAMRVAPEQLLDPDYLASRARLIDMKRAQDFGAGSPPKGGTVYLTAADAGGMMVSMIQSNFMGFGSGVVVPGTGISLQNRGSGFVLAPGHPNQVAPGKRPFHTIIPGFVTRSGAPVMSFGLMGGSMQPQGHTQMMVRMADYGQGPQGAIDGPRFRVVNGLEITFEDEWPEATIAELASRGHKVMKLPEDYNAFGCAQIAYRLEDGYLAASDARRDSLPVGF